MAETKVLAGRINEVLTKKLVQSLWVVCGGITKVVIYRGIVGSDDGTALMEVTSTLEVYITSSGANGLDTGSEAANTWYYVYLIYNPSTATVAGLLSASATSPTMPSGYTKKRLVSCVRNDASSNLIVYRQADGIYRYFTQQNVVTNGSNTVSTAVDCSSYVPSIAKNVFVQMLGWTTTNQAVFCYSRLSFIYSYQYCYAEYYYTTTAANLDRWNGLVHTVMPFRYPYVYYLNAIANCNTIINVEGFDLVF